MANPYCVQCGAKLENGARFCTECGAPQSGGKGGKPSITQTTGSSNKLLMPLLLLGIGVLLIGGALFALLNRPEPVPEVSNSPAATAVSDIPYPDVARISIEEARANAEADTAVIVDVRPFEDYQTLHAANAISLPLTELNDRYTELPRDVEILTYCT